jgi:hypothetical protein
MDWFTRSFPSVCTHMPLKCWPKRGLERESSLDDIALDCSATSYLVSLLLVVVIGISLIESLYCRS